MKQKPIYVEINIASDIETLWEYTQNPHLHKEWDLRFSDITYLLFIGCHMNRRDFYMKHESVLG